MESGFDIIETYQKFGVVQFFRQEERVADLYQLVDDQYHSRKIDRKKRGELLASIYAISHTSPKEKSMRKALDEYIVAFMAERKDSGKTHFSD